MKILFIFLPIVPSFKQLSLIQTQLKLIRDPFQVADGYFFDLFLCQAIGQIDRKILPVSDL